jgi:hypothetical protein
LDFRRIELVVVVVVVVVVEGIVCVHLNTVGSNCGGGDDGNTTIQPSTTATTKETKQTNSVVVERHAHHRRDDRGGGVLPTAMNDLFVRYIIGSDAVKQFDFMFLFSLTLAGHLSNDRIHPGGRNLRPSVIRSSIERYIEYRNDNKKGR